MTAPDHFTARPLRRKEDRRLITGHGRYVGDIPMEGMLHAVFVRSDVAHGILGDIDTDDARNTPGVVAVYTAADLDLRDIPSAIRPAPVEGMTRPILARDRIRHAGEAVAMIVAESPALAADAAGLAWVDVEGLPAIVEPESALSDDPVLHAAAGTNVVERFVLGEPPEDWSYPIDVTVKVRNQRLAPLSIEPLAALAVPRDGGFTIHVGHQTPHKLKQELIDQLGVNVEVIVPDVGGGFGMKARIYPEYVAIAAAAMRLGRPVRWLPQRRENLLTGTHGRDMIHTVRLAGDASGRFQRVHIDMLAAVGAYPHLGAQVPTFTRLVSQQMYDIPDLTISSTTVVTNAAPIAPYRGAGRPEAAYAMERAVDAFARAAGLDPVVVRKLNVFRSEMLPHRTATGAIYDSGDYPAAIDKAVELLNLEEVRREQAARHEGGADPIGVGFGAFIERAGGPADSGEYARVEMTEDGDLVVRTGSTSNGQGHETVWAQLAADVFDLPPDRVRVIAGDTSQVSEGWGSTASRSAQIGGSGVWRTSQRLRERAEEIAAEMLEAARADITLHEGRFGVAGVPDVGVSLAEVAAYAADRGIDLADEEFYSPHAQTFPYGVHAAVVEVLLETGEVRLLDVVAVDDCGNVLNPMIVEGQVHGSVVQGLGQALYEELKYGTEGQLQSATLMDYVLPRADDVPDLVTTRLVTPAPSNPLGVKGAGEGGCIGTPPAIVNAVLDALAPYGVNHLDMPLRPQKVWEAIQAARKGEG